VKVSPLALYRISRFDTGEPHFGTTGNNRFDDASRPKHKRYGCCYFGLALETALAETLLHDEVAVRGAFRVSQAHLAQHFLVRFDGSMALVLADLTGEALKTLGGDGSISTELPATMPRRWSRAVHRHPDKVDGILYMSRHLNDRKAVVLFDRARRKLNARVYTPLPKARGIFAAVTALHISLQYP
jgi:hypothetical protein